jgi:hypothetical protein
MNDDLAIEAHVRAAQDAFWAAIAFGNVLDKIDGMTPV